MRQRMENEGGARRVVVTKDLPGRRWIEVLTGADCAVMVCESRAVLTVDDIKAAIGDRCDGVIGQLTEPWGTELFDALRVAGGKVYSNYAVGFDNVRVHEATERGIAVGNTPGVLTETTAEMAVALTFAAARRVGEAERFLRDGSFDGWLPDLFLGKRLWGGTLGIVGAGRIGTEFARMLAPGHSMDVLYSDVVDRPELEAFLAGYSDLVEKSGRRRLVCRRVERIEELLERSDVVSLHTPLTDETRHLMNGERLARMKPDALLVNTARGPIIDEAALVAHLRANPGFRAGLDVFEDEPALAAGLADMPNVVIVPHIASATDWTREGMATLAACNVAAVLQGHPATRELVAEHFLAGDVPDRAPSILNASELGLALA